jgi:ketosteroid isomerase-like protein
VEISSGIVVGLGLRPHRVVGFYMSSIETVLDLLDRINKGDTDKMAELMTEDHEFFDSLGNTVLGREKMRAAWQGYYSFCPDYWVTHEEILGNGNIVAVFGAAGGTIATRGKLPPENKWRTSSAWLATVENSLVLATSGRTPNGKMQALNDPTTEPAHRGSCFAEDHFAQNLRQNAER